MQHRIDRLLHELRGVVKDPVIHSLGEVLLELLHGLADASGELERVRAGGLEHGDRERRLVVEETAHAVGLSPELDARDVAEAHDLSVIPGLHDDVAELLLVREPARGVQRDLELGAGRGRRAELPRGHLHVLLADGRHHIARGEVTRGELLRIEPHPHRVVTADRKSTRLNSSHTVISYAVFCLKKKNTQNTQTPYNYR